MFSWRPGRLFDVVFFSFWLSPVSRLRFAAFWTLVRSCPAPGGRVYLIDNGDDQTPEPVAQDPYVVRYGSDLHLRRLGSGFEYRVVKVMYEPTRRPPGARRDRRPGTLRWTPHGGSSSARRNPMSALATPDAATA